MHEIVGNTPRIDPHMYPVAAFAGTATLSCVYSLKTGKLHLCKETRLKPFYAFKGSRVYMSEGESWRLYDFLSDKILSPSRYAEIYSDYISGYHVVLTEQGKVALVSATGKEFFE